MNKEKHQISVGRKPTFFERACTNLVINLFDKIEKGGVTFRLPDGSERHFGDRNSQLQARMTINDHGFFKEAVLGGDIGLGEAYMKGMWDTDDIPRLFSVLIKNRQALADGHLVTAWLMLQKDRLVHALRANTIIGSRKNIGEHYDLNNDFFKTFLDPTMLYSCGFYQTKDNTCEGRNWARSTGLSKRPASPHRTMFWKSAVAGGALPSKR